MTKKRLIRDPERIALAIADELAPEFAGEFTAPRRHPKLVQARAGIARGLHGLGYKWEAISAALRRTTSGAYGLANDEKNNTDLAKKISCAILARYAEFMEDAPEVDREFSPSLASVRSAGTVIVESGAIYRRDHEGRIAFREDNEPHKRFIRGAMQ